MVKTKLEEGQIVICTVDKIIGTSVFVKLDDFNLTGSISFPEIAPGRIRNIRDYAFPGKKIVCKVLSIRSDTVELSLRRVKVNERNDFNDKSKRERTYNAIIKTALGEKSEETIKKIKESEDSIYDFIENSKDDPKNLEKYLGKAEAEKVLKILKEKETKVKEITITREFSLASKNPDGIQVIKNIMSEASKGTGIEFFYVAAGKYLAKVKSKNPKQDEFTMNQVLEKIDDLSKKKYCASCTFNANK